MESRKEEMNYQGKMTISSHKELTKDVFEMVVEGDAAKYIKEPGQFVNIKITDDMTPYLRRLTAPCILPRKTAKTEWLYLTERSLLWEINSPMADMILPLTMI